MFRWHPSGSRQRGSTSSRGSHRNTFSRPLTHQEDAQPNESVDKRQRCPPAINTAAPQQPPQRGGYAPRRHTRFVPRGTSGPTRLSSRYVPPPPPTNHPPLATGGAPTPSNAIELASNYAWSSGNTVAMPSTQPSQPSPPKRRKLEGPPVAEINLGSRTGGVALAPTPSMSPVSSETLVGEQLVKKERSISPELSSTEVTEPRLITAGTKRYVPLPPECMKSQANFKAARSAWAWKEQEALRRLGFKVVRTFVREDGMAIDWETTVDTHPASMAAVIEPAVLLDRAVVSDGRTQSVYPTPASLAYTSPDLNLPAIERERSSSSVVEVVPPATLEARGGRKFSEGTSSRAVTGKMSNLSSDPYLEGGSQQYEHPRANTIDTPVRLRRSPRKSVHNSPSDRSQVHQTASSVPSHTAPSSSQKWKQSPNPQTPLGSSQKRSTLSQPLPSPSQRAMDTLHNILHLKRQFGRDLSESPKPPAVSSPSPLRKLYPIPRTPKSGSPSQRSTGSFADAVAAAINEGARLDQEGPSSSPVPSTPLRVYKKRISPLAISVQRNGSATPRADEEYQMRRSQSSGRQSNPPLMITVQRNEGSATPRADEKHQMRRSQSSGSQSNPPIAVLGPGSSSESWKAPSSVNGEEYDELELSYPSSPMRPSPGPRPDSLPPSNVPTDPPPLAAGPMEQATQPSLSGYRPPSSENALMRSSAMRYLEQYCQTFDVDRRALADAYAPDAAFSCSSRKLRAQGREGILDALQALGPGVLCSGHSVEYDVTYLGPRIGVLLVALGTMGDTRGDNTGEVGYAMSFVLRPGGEDQERPAGELRPLVAAVHQMVLRDERPQTSGALMS